MLLTVAAVSCNYQLHVPEESVTTITSQRPRTDFLKSIQQSVDLFKCVKKTSYGSRTLHKNLKHIYTFSLKTEKTPKNTSILVIAQAQY